MSEIRRPLAEEGSGAPGAGAARPVHPPIASSALQVNLARTAFRGIIPQDQRLLLHIVREKVGLHQQMEALLREINHPYANWAEIVEPLRSRALGDFHLVNRHPRGAEALSLFVDLLFRCLDRCEDPASRNRCLATLLDLLERIFVESGAAAGRNVAVTDRALARLRAWLASRPGPAARGSSGVRKAAERVVAAKPSAGLKGLARLLLECLQRNYELWLAQGDLEAWLRREKDRSFGGREYGPLFRPVGVSRVRQWLEELAPLRAEAERDPASALRRAVALPDHDWIQQEHLNIVRRMGQGGDPAAHLHRTRVLLHFLEIPALSGQSETVLRELGGRLRELRDEDGSVWRGFLDAFFRMLREQSPRHRDAVLDAVAAVGREVYETGNRRLVELFQEQAIRLGFEDPDIRGVSRDWQVMANPLHLKNVRVWLSLIRKNPAWSRPLISALIIHLKLGGFFVGDTDLFQRDVSELLAADIGECYALIKALARLFPVYYHEIGAEGELREVSATVDDLSGRRDALIHFLRKQSHVESNNQLVPFLERIMVYWRTGERETLRPFLPRALCDELPAADPYQREMAPVFARVLEDGRRAPRDLLALTDRGLLEAVRDLPGVSEETRRKAALLIRLYRLMVKKYTIDHHDIVRDLRASGFFEAQELDGLEADLSAPRPERSLARIHRMLSLLRQNILTPGACVPQEEIYRKRHIAVGIPSLYGRYKEKRFDSLGLTFRLESLATVLLEELAANLNLDYVTRSTLEKVYQLLARYAHCLELDGIAVHGLQSNLDLLGHALESRRITVDQYLNIAEFFARSVKEIIHTQYMAVHEANLRTVIAQRLQAGRGLPGGARPGGDTVQAAHRVSEGFIRDYLAGSFGIQGLDNFIGRVMGGLAQESQSLDRKTRTLLLSYDPEKCFHAFDNPEGALNTQIYLGNKGYFLKRLRAFGYPVPPGFIVTTELFRCRHAILAYEAAEADFRRRLRQEVRRLEQTTGRAFGDPRRPLLLSVRSGSTITMPGMMDTFLNIGINDEIVESMARQPRFAWAAWDNYRRFLQCWGMSCGIARDRFDELLSATKRIYSARYKRELLPEQMREVAHAYRKLLREASVPIALEPWEQLETAIYRVLDSWRSEKASLYRRVMKIADEWGTAVIIQQMVFGNQDMESGTGVAFTRHPRETGSGVTLHGDYTLCAQGEDVVSGLVATYPLSDRQMAVERRDGQQSLERRMPRIYGRLRELAGDLVLRRGFHHQEIEFTFEGPEADALFVLQARDMPPPEKGKLRVFVPTPGLQGGRLGTGIGVGGGALAGVAVHRAEETAGLRERFPGAPLIMLRPDTVPDDIGMMIDVDGVLTARGGSTSHAAIAAHRLGKPCVVGFRKLQVNERLGKSAVGDHVIRSGDWIGIDGHNGSVYAGRHETMVLAEDGKSP